MRDGDAEGVGLSSCISDIARVGGADMMGGADVPVMWTVWFSVLQFVEGINTLREEWLPCG